MKKSISSAVASFVKQKGYTPEQAKALSKLTGLNKHRDLVPMHYKSPEYVKQSSRIYKANKDVKKSFSATSPAAGPKSVVPPKVQSKPAHKAGVDDILSSWSGKKIPPAPAPFDYKKPQYAGEMSKPSGIGISEAIDRFAKNIPAGQHQPLAKLGALKTYGQIVPMHHKSKEYVGLQSKMYQARSQLKKAAGLPGPVPKGTPKVAVLAPQAAKAAIEKKIKPFLGGKLTPALEKVTKDLSPSQVAELGKLGAKELYRQMSSMTLPEAQLSKPKFTSMSKKHRTAYAPDEKSAMVAYSGSEYASINGSLRKGDAFWQENGYYQPHHQEAIKKKIAALDTGLAKHKTPTDLRLHRGVGGAEYFAGLKPGDSFTEKGYSSASAFVDSSFKSKPVHLRIHVPKGYAAPVISSGIPSENEILLPRNTKFEIIKKRTIKVPSHYGEKTKEVIHVRVIPHEGVPGIDMKEFKAKGK